MNYNFTEIQKNKIIEKWGQDFYTQLLNNIAIYSKKWSLSDFEFVEYYSSSTIFFCKSELHGDCALKIPGGIREYRALRAYNNSGKYCQVYEFDSENSVLLIERITPGEMLSVEPSLEKRLAVFSDLFNGLHVEPEKSESSDESQEEWVNGLADHVIDNRQSNEEFYAHALKAKEIYAEMTSVYDRKALLHMDLHFDNILSCGNGKYKIIDPFGWIGDPIFEIGHFIFFEYSKVASEQQFKTVDKICSYFEKHLHIPKKISKQCLYIDVTMWNFWHIYDGHPAYIDDVLFAESILNHID